MYSDDIFENEYFSQISGMSLLEINFLELQFLGIVEFNLMVSSEEHDSYKTSLYTFFEGE